MQKEVRAAVEKVLEKHKYGGDVPVGAIPLYMENGTYYAYIQKGSWKKGEVKDACPQESINSGQGSRL